MPTLFDKVSVLSGLGAIGSKALAKMDVRTVRDLLFHFPFRYEDYSKFKEIKDLQGGETVSLLAELVSIEARKSLKSRIMVTEAIVKDDTGELTVKWFNQPFLTKTLKPGQKLSLSGHVDVRQDLVIVNPRYEKIRDEDDETVHTGRIIPIYSRSGAVGEKRLRNAMRESLPAALRLVDRLPEHIRKAEQFLPLSDALQMIHFPETMEELDQAVARLKFDELFLHQLLFADVRKEQKTQVAHQIPVNEVLLKEFVAKLPFELTPAQKISAWDIVQDLAKEHPMNRMLEGDVGSGKTVVAAMAMYVVLEQGKQATYLAPTEILAKQQYVSLQNFLGVDKVALLTRTDCSIGGESCSRADLEERLRDGDSIVVIATHAILQDNWVFKNLAFVVVDEQHRFGVRQRHSLLSRSEIAPHLLSMSATPIPRSLSLTVYGDLDLSIINELPKGRKPIATQIVFDKSKAQMYDRVRTELDKGNRVYVVCPLISGKAGPGSAGDPSDKLGVTSVSETATMLRKTHLKDYSIAELNGRMKSDEKAKIMSDFKEGKTPVLISTTVVEVGLDVPEATVMLIEGAERFGLAQLHQLRGRVGRSDRPSYCFLRPGGFIAGKTLERLQAMVKSQNGFDLAELDLEFRGPGNVFGDAQSGFPDFNLATLADVPLMKKARDWATKLLDTDPNLEKFPLVREFILEAADDLHLE